MKGFVAALRFMTRLPLPRIAADTADFGAAMRWFPAVGLVIGALVAGAAWTGQRVDDWTGALLALGCWVAVTGALHLDGLGDIADAVGAAHRNRERLLAVLADPHIGSFGVTAIGLQLIAKLILLHGLIADGDIALLVLVPFAARIGPLAWTLWLPPLHQGLAARFGATARASHLVVWGVALALGALLVPALLAAPLLIALWGLWLRRAVGGISGDGHGAGIELVESGLLLALLVAGRL